MNWEKVKLSDVCDVLGGYAFKSENFKNEGTPLLRISNIYDGEISFKEDCVCVENSNLESLQKFKVKKGDILLALSGATTGKFGVYNLASDAFLNQRVGLIRATEKLNQKYLLFYFNIFKAQIEQIAQGAAQPNISTNEICNLQIPLPPLPTQKRIAEILDAADALRRKDQALLKKYDELAQAIFIDMFGDPVKNEKGWEVKKLGELSLKITDGTHQSPKFTKSGVPFLFVSNIVGNKIVYETDTFISSEEFDFLNKRTPIEIGNLLITTVGSYGNPAIIENETKFAFQRHIAFIKPNHDLINYMYLFGFLKSPVAKYQIDKKVNGIAQKTLNLGDLKDIQVWNPPRELQDKYSKILLSLNTQISNKTNVETESLFNSLLQKAFTGELVA